MVLVKSPRSILFRAVILLIGGLVAALTVSACEVPKATKKIVQILSNPDIPIGDQKDQPSIATLTVYAESGSNRNQLGESVPIDIWIYQLRDDSTFKTLDYFGAIEQPKEYLSTSYVDHVQLRIEDGDSRIVDRLEINKNTRYIGVIGGYSDAETQVWRQAEKINFRGEEYKILITLSRTGVKIHPHR